jgi:hypothetical protein
MHVGGGYHSVVGGNITSKERPSLAIKREVILLIDLQIETLPQRSALDSYQLLDGALRKNPKDHGEPDRIMRARIEFRSQRAS